MIWNRMAFILTLFGNRRAAGEVAKRWTKAHQRDPELIKDVIRMGGILVAQPFQNGEVADLDPSRLAYEAGRRDLALQLTALMGLTTHELNSLMEDDD